LSTTLAETRQILRERETNPYLAITEHTAIVSSHTVFDHGHASYSEKFLLQLPSQHIFSRLLTAENLQEKRSTTILKEVLENRLTDANLRDKFAGNMIEGKPCLRLSYPSDAVGVLLAYTSAEAFHCGFGCVDGSSAKYHLCHFHHQHNLLLLS
jgi:hypothetical protein